MNDESTLQRVVQQIEAYLVKHPQANDSVEGAEQWWLDGREARPTVERALELLVQRGVLQRSVNTDSTVVYSARRTRPPRP